MVMVAAAVAEVVVEPAMGASVLSVDGIVEVLVVDFFVDFFFFLDGFIGFGGFVVVVVVGFDEVASSSDVSSEDSLELLPEAGSGLRVKMLVGL